MFIQQGNSSTLFPSVPIKFLFAVINAITKETLGGKSLFGFQATEPIVTGKPRQRSVRNCLLACYFRLSHFAFLYTQNHLTSDNAAHRKLGLLISVIHQKMPTELSTGQYDDLVA